jgi:TonB family protein
MRFVGVSFGITFELSSGVVGSSNGAPNWNFWRCALLVGGRLLVPPRKCPSSICRARCARSGSGGARFARIAYGAKDSRAASQGKSTCGCGDGFFQKFNGKLLELGTLLADKFSESLAASARGFKVLGRKTLSEYLVQNWTTLEDLQSTDVFFQIGRQMGASGVILGTMQEENCKLYLTLHLVGFCPSANPKDIFEATDDRIRFPLTDELHALLFEPGPNFTRKPDQIPEEPGIFKANISGVSSPKCLYCPQRGYSDVARAAKYQGSVTLSIVVTAEGEVTSIYVMKAALFGLTTEAIKDAKQWRMEQGKKDDKPVSVRVQIESSFHLY